MNRQSDIAQRLQTLLTEYKFNVDTLSRYLGLSVEQIKALSLGQDALLPQDASERFRIFEKILFLYASGAEDKGVKLRAFLQVLVSYHGLSDKTVAKMSGVELEDIHDLLADPPRAVSEEVKRKVAVTVMALRFFLKDSEPHSLS